MYNDYSSWDYLSNSFGSVWGGVANFVPRFLAALIVFIIGWFLAIVAGKVVWHIVKFIQLDRGLENVGFKKIWERSGYKLNSGLFFFELVKWAVIIGFLMTATNILGLTQVSEFLQRVIIYLPNVFVAAIILIIGVLVARLLEGLVRGSVRAANLASGNFLGTATRWIVVLFSVLIALEQLQIGTKVILIAASGIGAGIALAIGLAFGLGGRDHAEELITKWRKNVQE